MIKRFRSGGSSGPIGVQLAATFGLLVAVGLFVLVALIAPDRGPTLASIRQGLGLALVFASPSIGALLAPERAVDFGGGLFVAATATMLGGNVPLATFTIPGLVLMMAGASTNPPVTVARLGRLILVAAALIIGVFLAGGTQFLAGLGVGSVALLVGLLGWTSRAPGWESATASKRS